MMSDDSENDGIYVDRLHENNIYYKKYKLLLEECETIQKSNERLVYRIEEVKKITKRRLNQVEYIKQRLKQYNEDWTEIPHAVHEPMSPTRPAKSRDTAKSGKQRKAAPPPSLQTQSNSTEEKPTGKAKRPPKRKLPKAERDPRAPKRPSNPFFQFCQEQRQPLMEQLVAELQPGQAEPNKQELTRQLAIRWKTLSPTQKQVYVDMYEKSKEKYAVEMSEYNMKK